MKILLAIDSSAASQTAIEEVGARPWPAGTSVEVLNVIEPAHFWTVSKTAEGILQQSAELVDGAAEQLASRGLEAAAESSFGDPKAVILDHAKRTGVDFIVLGGASSVVRHAPCSVEIVRRSVRKILLATDGSASSEMAARSIAARPWPPDAEVRVLSVVEFFLPTIQALFEPPFIESEQIETLRLDAMKHAQEAVANAVEILTVAGLKVSESVSVLLSGPKKVILEEAKEWGADLIVMGSHGRHGIDRFLMGSVSEAVATHAECSVEIIRSTG